MSTKGKRSQARESNLAQKYQTPGQCTTVMVRNIPNEYTQDELIQEVSENMGSAELFDFFYLPWDSQNNGNIGYAFVNFLDSLTAQKAVRIFSNYKFRLHDSRKVGKVSPAHIQGLENNLRHLQDRAVVHGNHPCSPVVMWRGRKIELSAIFQELRTQDTLQKFGAPQSFPGRPASGRPWPDDQVCGASAAYGVGSATGALEPPGMGSMAGGMCNTPLSMPNYAADNGVGECFAQVLDRAAGLGLEAMLAWDRAQGSHGPPGPQSAHGGAGTHGASAPGLTLPGGLALGLQPGQSTAQGLGLPQPCGAGHVANDPFVPPRRLDVGSLGVRDLFEAEDDDATECVGHRGHFGAHAGHLVAPLSAPAAQVPVLFVSPPASAPALPASADHPYGISPGIARALSLRSHQQVPQPLPTVADLSNSSVARTLPPGLTPATSNFGDGGSSPGRLSSPPTGGVARGPRLPPAPGLAQLGSNHSCGSGGSFSPTGSGAGGDAEKVIALNTRFEGLSTRATDVELFQHPTEANTLEINVQQAHDDVLQKFFSKFGT